MFLLNTIEFEGLQGRVITRIEENAKQGTFNENFDEQYQAIEERIRDLKQKKLKQEQEKRMAESYSQRLEGMDDCLK